MAEIDKYNDIIQKYANKYSLDPVLMKAIIMKESGGRPHLHNQYDPSGGAWGLAQFLLPTAKMLGYRGEAEGLLDPETNIMLLAQYMNMGKQHGAKTIDDFAKWHNGGNINSRAVKKSYIDDIKTNYNDFKSEFGKKNILDVFTKEQQFTPTLSSNIKSPVPFIPKTPEGFINPLSEEGQKDFWGFGDRITQKFGNINRQLYADVPGNINRGTDIAMSPNTPIQAPETLVVVEAKTGGWNTGWGNYVLAQNPRTNETYRFSHLNKINVTPGQVIAKGEVLGLSGQTGRTTGPHLDLEYAKNNVLADITRAKPDWFGKLTNEGQNMLQSIASALKPQQAYAMENPARPVPQKPSAYMSSGQNYTPALNYTPAKMNYTVKTGDTLWDIAQKNLGSGSRWKELQGYSGDPRKLPVGTQLNIGGGTGWWDKTKEWLANTIKEQYTPKNINSALTSGFDMPYRAFTNLIYDPKTKTAFPSSPLRDGPDTNTALQTMAGGTRYRDLPEEQKKAVSGFGQKWGMLAGFATPLNTAKLPSADKLSRIKGTGETGVKVAQPPKGDMGKPQNRFLAKLTQQDIVKTDPVINLKREVPAKDISGAKVVLPQGESYTPYQLKGNKVLLKDGQEIVVNKNQYQNIKGNAVSGEAKEFAPELKQIEETIKGAGRWQGDELIDNGKTVANLIKNNNGTWSYQSDFSEGSETFSNRVKAMKEAEMATIGDVYGKSSTKYSQYQLPDGKNYREILIKAPEKSGGKPISASEWADAERAGDLMGDYETYLKEFNSGKALGKSNFQSSHWDEPNVISHIRMNDRTYKGKKVAFLEEMQSDWAREARSKGINSGDSQVIKEFEEYNQALAKKYNLNPGHNLSMYGTIKKMKPEEIAKWDNLQHRWIEATQKTPNHPLLKNWQEPTIKRALKEAVDNDAEYFSWTTGEQQAQRYNLSKQVDNISWKTTDGLGGKRITITPKDARRVQDQISFLMDKDGVVKSAGGNVPDNWMGKNVGEVIGKGIGEKILKSTNGVLKEEGLNIGGEWANQLYDKQIKNIVEDVTGTKVEKLDLGLPVDAKESQFRISKGSSGGTFWTLPELTLPKLKVGTEIARFDGVDQFRGKYIITDVLGDGKFKAVTKRRIDEELAKRDYKVSYKTFAEGANETTMAKMIPKTFDISTKSTVQHGIRLTPEIKAKIRGEAPPIKKPSEKWPFNFESPFKTPSAKLKSQGLLQTLAGGGSGIMKIPSPSMYL